jgi:hypothetical protein
MTGIIRKMADADALHMRNPAPVLRAFLLFRARLPEAAA